MIDKGQTGNLPLFTKIGRNIQEITGNLPLFTRTGRNLQGITGNQNLFLPILGGTGSTGKSLLEMITRIGKN